MPSKLDVRDENDFGVVGDRTRRSESGGQRPPIDEWSLLVRIAVLTFPFEPRIIKRKDGSSEVQWKMSGHYVQEKLAKEGIELSLRRVLAYQDKIFNLRIVDPIVNLPYEEREVYRLEGVLKWYFNIPGCVLLVSGFPAMLDPEITYERRRYFHEQVMQKMVMRLAAYLDDLLALAARTPRAAEAPIYTVVMAWGRTMRLLADELDRTRRRGPWPSPLRFQAAVGPTFARQSEPEEANAIVKRVAPMFGAKAAEVPNEAFVTRELWESARRRPPVAEAMRSIYEGDIFLTAIGATDRISNDAEMNNEVLAAMRAAKAVADICTVLINEDGGEVRTRYVGVGPTYDGMRRMVQDPNRHLIIATGGDARRMIAVRAALRGKLVSDLVTDTVTGRWLVGEITDPVA